MGAKKGNIRYRRSVTSVGIQWLTWGTHTHTHTHQESSNLPSDVSHRNILL